MSERKVLNKYFPPNFDPSKIPRQKRPKDLQHKVRLMAPFSMRCESCGEYIHKGKKFNARKETVEGEQYLSIKIFRFYIRCPRCSAEITFKTDPKNTDYVAEHGASRNFEPWRDADGDEEEEEEEAEDPMAALENRTLDSKREMEILDALDEIRLRNARSQRVDVDDVLQRFSYIDKEALESRLKQEELEDEKEASEVFQSADGECVRKLAEGDEPDVFSLVASKKAAMATPTTPNNKPSQPSLIASVKRKAEQQQQLGIAVKRKTNNNNNSSSQPAPPKSNGNGKPATGLTMLASYDDVTSSEDED